MEEYTKTLNELKELIEIRDGLKADLAAADPDSLLAEAIQEDLAMVNDDIADKTKHLANL